MSKYEFPSRGFHIVADKVCEADYFLGKMKLEVGSYSEFGFLFSAFLSAARSVTFSLQAVMSKYPGFDEWYAPKQKELKDSQLARFFVEVRNYSQKVGNVPLFYSGRMVDGVMAHSHQFVPSEDIRKVPGGEVIANSEAYFRLLLGVIERAYRDYSVYVDPRAIFSIEGLRELDWSIEDLEESLGFPRGWTDIDWDGGDKDEQRLKLLSRHGGDEILESFFGKYKIH